MATNTGLGVNFDDVYVLLQSPNGKKTFQETTCESPLSEAQFADTTMKTKTTTKAKLDERKGKEKDIKCKRIVSNVKQKLGDFGDIRKLLSDGGISVVDIKATATTMTNVPPSPCNGLRNLTTTKPKRELLSNTSGNKTSKSAESVLSFVKSIIATAPRQKVAAPSITSFDSSAIVPAVSISSSSFSTSSSLSSLSSIANNGINGRPSQRLKKQKFRSATDISSLSSTSFSKQKSLMLPLPPQEKATRARSQSTSNLLTPSPKKTLLPMMDYIRDSHAINETTFAHIFIDHSNIYWGFKDYVKRSRNNSLEKGKTELNYEMLFNILLSPLKGPPRKLVKGVLVGSAPMDNGEEVLQVTQAHGFEAHILYRYFIHSLCNSSGSLTPFCVLIALTNRYPPLNPRCLFLGLQACQNLKPIHSTPLCQPLTHHRILLAHRLQTPRRFPQPRRPGPNQSKALTNSSH